MGIEIKFFTEFTFAVSKDGVRLGTFKRFPDSGYFFKQSDIYCMSASQLAEVAEALKTFEPEKYMPEYRDDGTRYDDKQDY